MEGGELSPSSFKLWKPCGSGARHSKLPACAFLSPVTALGRQPWLCQPALPLLTHVGFLQKQLQHCPSDPSLLFAQHPFLYAQ